MSGNKWGVTPKLPAMLTGKYPIIVTKSGLSYEISFGNSQSSVSKRQFFAAVSNLYSMTTLFAAVSANPDAPVWWQFFGGQFVNNDPTDPIYALTKTTFGLNATQMNALFTFAAAQPY